MDGRDIKRQWIMDAAELYDPNLYTALLWPEHSRNYGNRGRVLAAMCQEGDDGIMRLYVQLCPNISLMQANAEGQLLFCSAEFTPDGNFRGTGKSYLEGLGVTDSPASVYTERMRFSKRHKNKRYGALKPLAFDEVKEIKEEVKMSGNKKKGWRSMFSIEEEPQQPEIPPMAINCRHWQKRWPILKRAFLRWKVKPQKLQTPLKKSRKMWTP
ncbi:GPO family capsid scaffolding protein [Serratia ureilytica]